MNEKFYTIMTSIGKASITNATTLGGKVDFKYMALGDGNGTYYSPVESQTTLVNEVHRTQINHIQVDPKNPSWIRLSIVIPANVGGFTVREVGAFDAEGNLLIIGKYPETYKPVLDDGSTKDLTINMILEVSNASIVNLRVDPSVVIATNEYVDDKFKELAGTGRTTETVKKNADKIKGITEGSISYEDLETVDKTLKGAINELKAKDDSLDTRITKNTDDIAELNTQMADTMQQIAEIEKQLSNYNSYASIKDDNGIFTVVEYKRTDGTLYMKSTLSNANADGKYQTNVWLLYDDLGIEVIQTIPWTISYDTDGDIISKVVVI